ncbi:MAG: PAS domain S-box protein [Myxococcales bacterium]
MPDKARNVAISDNCAIAGDGLGHPNLDMFSFLQAHAEGTTRGVPMLNESSNELYKSQGVLDHAPFGLHVYQLTPDERLVFLDSNATASRILGVDHRPFVGLTIEEAFPALVETEIPERYRAVAKTKQPWTTDQIDYDEQGIRGAFEVHAVPMPDNRMAAFFTDITARLRIEYQLRVKQLELDTYFTHAQDLLCIATTDGRFKRLNPEWERTLGFPLTELQGRLFLDFVHPDDLERTAARLGSLAAQQKVINFVNRFRCSNGEYRSLEWRSFPNGTEIYATARDITERLAMVERLQESEALYRSLVATMNETVSLNQVIFNEQNEPIDYLVLDVNPEWERVFGLPRDKVVGRRATEVSGMAAPEYLQEFAAVALGGPPLRFETHNARYQRNALVSVTSPRRGLFVAVASDITERVQAEQQLQRALRDLTAKGQELESLLYVTTHDLRSPLVNIQGFSARIARVLGELTGILEERPDAPPFTRESVAAIAERLTASLSYISNSAKKMDRLITGLLQLSRLGRRPLQWADVNMEALWQQVLTLFSHQLREAEAEIRSGPLPPCHGDQSQLDQVLSNLLDNALKYRDPRRPCVVSFSGTRQADGSVLYQFEDTSRGIAPEHLDRIWELFHRLTPHEDLPGDGIGLTAVRQIITRHGGEISVRSEPGVGSTFLFRIPLTSS